MSLADVLYLQNLKNSDTIFLHQIEYVKISGGGGGGGGGGVKKDKKDMVKLQLGRPSTYLKHLYVSVKM